MKRIIIGISGASGVIYGKRILEVLRDTPNIETHLIISNAARKTIILETNLQLHDFYNLADVVHNTRDITANIASGSFKTEGMIIIPCSIKTLSGIVHSYTDNLLIRSADVILKERRRLVLCVRETPLHLGHLRMLAKAVELGAIIMPPVPAFYHHPKTLQDIIDQTINRIIDQFDIYISQDLFIRWQGKCNFL
ncbi:Flavin prenyltransferase UbiX [Candidatus Profftia lariciata]|uniref:UbiX family flavin prenyltransferase n=1 Tax=Candidatus Profftia lariciata TaxID=1987921 RepID=UPI001D0245A0|nr:UbiX family flavin prenyltransferase [Candidatus Profftia lariciata]UDG81742.1 Flavin prenyltransferase UbiX [Candidatus Profftia lariciata]